MSNYLNFLRIFGLFCHFLGCSTWETNDVSGACTQLPRVMNGSLWELRSSPEMTGCLNCQEIEEAKAHYVVGQKDDGSEQIDWQKLEADKNIKRKYRPGTVFQIQCDFGFEKARGSEFTMCHANGTWAPEIARCQYEVLCRLPVTPANAEIVRWSDGNSANFRPGQVVEYACGHNYEMQGSSLIACTQDGRWSDHPPQCVQSNQIYMTPYWSSLRSRPTASLKLCDDAAIHGILPDPDSQHQAIVVCFNGVIKSIKSDCQTVLWSGKVEPPVGIQHGIWYSAFDRVKRKLYFTLSARAGIFVASFDTVKVNSYFNETVLLDYFVPGDDRKSFYGLAIDEKRRVLYCTDPVRGNIGIWSLESPNQRKFIRAPSSVNKFQPAFIALSPLPIPAKDDDERLMAVSDWNNDQIYIYRQKGLTTEDSRLNITHYYIGTLLTALRPRARDNSDPRSMNGLNATQHIQQTGRGEPRLGSIDGPLGLYFDSANNLLVADYLNHRLQIFDGGRDNKVVSEPLFRPSWASANLNAWVLVTMAMIDNSGAGSAKAKLGPVVMAGLGTGEVACFKN